MEIVGAALVVLCGASLGRIVGRGFRDRCRLIADLAAALACLETEVAFTRTPLVEALEKTGKRLGAPVGEFFTSVAAGLRRGDGRLAGAEWHVKLAEWSAPLPLGPDEVDALAALGPTLGASHAEDQINRLRAAGARLREIQGRAEAERDPRIRLWNYLGAGAGLVVALLLY